MKSIFKGFVCMQFCLWVIFSTTSLAESACRPIPIDILSRIKILDISFTKNKWDAGDKTLTVRGTLQNTNSKEFQYLLIHLYAAHSNEIRMPYGRGTRVDIKDANGETRNFPKIQQGEIFFFEGNIIKSSEFYVKQNPRQLQTTRVIMTFGADLCASGRDSDVLSYVIFIPTKEMTLDVQKKLVQFGYTLKTIDGVWGEETRTIVKQFQQEHQLDATGALDESTMKALGF